MSNQRDTRGISAQSCIGMSNIAQKCIELQMNIMPYAAPPDRETVNPSPYKGVTWL